MTYSTADHIFALVWVGVLPFAIVLCVALLFVVCVSRAKSVDVVTLSVVAARLVHCAAVLMATVFTLEHWLWADILCYILMWLWIAAWVADFITVLLFLLFYAGRIARKSPRSTCYVITLFLLVWVLAIVAGGVPYFVPHLFTNHDRHMCSIGLTVAMYPIPEIVLSILAIGFLLFAVLIIALIAETASKILIYWTSRKAEQRRVAVCTERGGEKHNVSREDAEQYWIQENGDVDMDSTASGTKANGTVLSSNHEHTDTDSVYEESTDWIRNAHSMKDIRNIVVTAGCFAILFDIIPHVVFFVMELGDYVSTGIEDTVWGDGLVNEYVHHVLLSSGLVHAVLLPAGLIIMSPRYYAVFKKACCHTRPSKRQKDENGMQKPQDLRLEISDVDEMVTEVNQGHAVSVDIADMTVDESSTDTPAKLKTNNGHINPVFTAAEIQVVIESADIIHSSPKEDQDKAPAHVIVTRSHSACVDRRQVVSVTNLQVKTATIRRSPSSVSQMVNPPVPENIYLPVENIYEASRENENPTDALTFEQIDETNKRRSEEVEKYEDQFLFGENECDEDSSYEDSDSELWSHLYDYDEDDIMAALENEDGVPIADQRLRKASLAVIAAHQMRRTSRVSRMSSTGSSNSLHRKEMERLRKKLAKKRRASIDFESEGDPGVKSGIAGLALSNMATGMALAGRRKRRASVDTQSNTVTDKGSNIPSSAPIVPNVQPDAIPVPPPPPPLPNTQHVIPQAPPPPPLPEDKLFSQTSQQNTQLQSFKQQKPDIPQESHALSDSIYSTTAKVLPPPPSNPPPPPPLPEELSYPSSPLPQTRNTSSAVGVSQSPTHISTSHTPPLSPSSPQPAPPPPPQPPPFPSSHVSVIQKTGSSKKTQNPVNTSIKSLKRQENVQHEAPHNQAERRPSFLNKIRPASLPPIALPEENNPQISNPFIAERPQSAVVPIHTQNPYIPMKKITKDKENILSSSNPFLNEIENSSRNPFLNETARSKLSPESAPPTFHTNNPFFEALQAAEMAEAERERRPSDGGVQTTEAKEARRQRAKKALRSAVMGASMVAFLRSRSEEQAEEV